MGESLGKASNSADAGIGLKGEEFIKAGHSHIAISEPQNNDNVENNGKEVVNKEEVILEIKESKNDEENEIMGMIVGLMDSFNRCLDSTLLLLDSYAIKRVKGNLKDHVNNTMKKKGDIKLKARKAKKPKARKERKLEVGDISNVGEKLETAIKETNVNDLRLGEGKVLVGESVLYSNTVSALPEDRQECDNFVDEIINQVKLVEGDKIDGNNISSVKIEKIEKQGNEEMDGGNQDKHENNKSSIREEGKEEKLSPEEIAKKNAEEIFTF